MIAVLANAEWAGWANQNPISRVMQIQTPAINRSIGVEHITSQHYREAHRLLLITRNLLLHALSDKQITRAVGKLTDLPDHLAGPRCSVDRP